MRFLMQHKSVLHNVVIMIKDRRARDHRALLKKRVMTRLKCQNRGEPLVTGLPLVW